jgi:hypothetical protein
MTLGKILFWLRVTHNENGRTDGQTRVNLNAPPTVGDKTESLKKCKHGIFENDRYGPVLLYRLGVALNERLPSLLILFIIF